MSNDHDQITPDEIKEWLKSVGETREWLAKACHVSKPTVDGWLSAGRSIPRPALSILKGLMGKRIEINPRIEMSLFLSIQALATQDGLTLNEWIENLIIKTVAARSKMGFPEFSSFTHKPELAPHLAAAAGPGIEAEVIETLDHTIRVKICGLSMDPLLADGQVIEMHSRIASRSPFMKKGLIYLVRIDGAYSVKRFNTRRPSAAEAGEEWAANGRVGLLESVNPAFPPITIKSEIEWLAWLDPKEIQ